MLNQTVSEYINDLASSKAAPGGGTAAALTGAQGAALLSMTCALTEGKKGCETAWQQAREIGEAARAIVLRMTDLANADIGAYTAVLAAYRLPKLTEREAAVRRDTIELRLAQAAEVPLNMMRAAVEGLALCAALEQTDYNRNVASDLASAVLLQRCAAACASKNVYINTALMKNREAAEALEAETAELLARAGC